MGDLVDVDDDDDHHDDCRYVCETCAFSSFKPMETSKCGSRFVCKLVIWSHAGTYVKIRVALFGLVRHLHFSLLSTCYIVLYQKDAADNELKRSPAHHIVLSKECACHG